MHQDMNTSYEVWS